MKETELKPCPSEKDVEKWLLSKGYFMDCRKCEERKEGCHKGCKFIQSYVARKEIRQ